MSQAVVHDSHGETARGLTRGNDDLQRKNHHRWIRRERLEGQRSRARRRPGDGHRERRIPGSFADRADGEGHRQRSHVVVVHRQPQAAVVEPRGTGGHRVRGRRFGVHVVHGQHREPHRRRAPGIVTTAGGLNCPGLELTRFTATGSGGDQVPRDLHRQGAAFGHARRRRRQGRSRPVGIKNHQRGVGSLVPLGRGPHPHRLIPIHHVILYGEQLEDDAVASPAPGIVRA